VEAYRESTPIADMLDPQTNQIDAKSDRLRKLRECVGVANEAESGVPLHH